LKTEIDIERRLRLTLYPFSTITKHLLSTMFASFTPAAGSLGGSLIGLSSAILLLYNGDILGASGIMSSVLTHPKQALSDPSQLWKLALMTTFTMTAAMLPQFANDPKSASTDIPTPSYLAMSLAGLLVGYGTRLGNGCTSGHGICGLGRQSPRSLAAVMTFMCTGMATAMITSPLAPWASATSFLRRDASANERLPGVGYAIAGVFAAAFLFGMSKIKSDIDSRKKDDSQMEDRSKVLGASLTGVVFAAGLAISGMIVPSKLYTFLNVQGIADGSWDPTLMTVMGCGIPVSFLAYQLVPEFGVGLFGKSTMSRPLKTSAFHVPTNRKLDTNLLLGQAIFGMGWGLGLLCPGPALFHVAIGTKTVVFLWTPAFAVGAALAQKQKAKQQ
jgi:uncharacterized membrane protein YedE/YeeE